MADATPTRDLLNAQAEGLREELLCLRQDLSVAINDNGIAQDAQLVEANEQLVLATLRADTLAEKAVANLAELTSASQRDPLTGTPNRALLFDRLESAIAMARRKGTRVAVLFLDLDEFKQINDTAGHATGDAVLQLVARRMESVVRDSDTVCHRSGDEFLVLLTEISDVSDAALIGEKMLSAIASPALAGGQPLTLSASIGVAMYPEDAQDATTLLIRADAAMYSSKRRGAGSLAFYKDESLGAPGLVPSAENIRREPLTRYEFSPNNYAPYMRDLLEANEQLVMAALAAKELEAVADAAHRRQMNFVATVAHELRNPLTPIRTAADMLHYADTDEPLRIRLQIIIKRQVAHLSRLVEDLLDGSRVRTGKFRLEHSAVDLANILSLAAAACRPAMDDRHQRVKIQIAPGPVPMQGDALRLTQVFSNLLDNASKYTPNGGDIAMSATVCGDTVVVTVEDNGVGISAAVLPEIFDLFVQDKNAIVLHGGGLGIGLAVVRELVEAHGGIVVAYSEGNNQGSKFVVTLPIESGSDLQGNADQVE